MRLSMNTPTARERSRRATQQPDCSQVSVDTGSDLEKKESSAPTARLSGLRFMRENTQIQRQYGYWPEIGRLYSGYS